MPKYLSNLQHLFLERIRPFLLVFASIIKRTQTFWLAPRNKNRLNTHTISLTIGAIAFILGSYFTISEVLLPRVRALTEVLFTMPTDTPLNATASGSLAGYDDGGGTVFVLSDQVTLATSSAWWKSDYTAKKTVTLKNLATIPLATQSATTQQITVNTKELYDAGTLQANCEDLRVVFVATESANMRAEVPRSYYPASGATNCSDSTATTIAFPLQEPLWANGGTSPNYELYYGNATATDPNYTDQGYSITRQDGSTASATLVCPFNGTTTCVGGETPTTATGAIRYSGGSALSFDGKDDTVTGNINLIGNNVTYEFWLKPTYREIGNLWSQPIKVGNGFWYHVGVQSRSDSYPHIIINGQDIGPNIGAPADNTWTHIAVTYDGSYVRFFKNGQLIGSPVSVTGDIASSTTYTLNSGTPYYNGLIDEVRISNTVRYTENFTPQTTPFEPDEYTKLLLHFDENGDDPRLSGKAFDSSGNGNHGTITGAKYVSGLVGVDNSSSSTGAMPASTTASHQGVFIEEGTTNLITNPSFEHSTYNTNWGTNYFNYATASATFTPGMAKRNSAGPFASGVLVQGKADGSISGDYIDIASSTYIGSGFNQYLDDSHGTIVFWLTPEWNGNDGLDHWIVAASDNKGRIYKSANGNLSFSIYNGTAWNSVAVDFSSAVVGSTYLIVARYDLVNTLDGNNHVGLSVNDLHNYGGTSSGYTPGNNFLRFYIGSNGSSLAPANAIIEGLTIYRRPLFDGQYGIDVGNGDEIAQIYNSGTGKDPTLVTGSWDVVFALPTNASTGALTTGTGNAWSHPHASNLLYTSTTNTGGFMMNGTYTSDGWADIGVPSVTASPTNQKIYSGGYAVTSNQWEGIYYDKTVVAGADWVIRGVAHSDGTCQPQLILYDQTNGAEIGSLYGTTTSTRTDPDILLFTGEAPAGMTTLRVKAVNAAASSGTCYWDQVEVLSNSINGPSLESGSGDPWLPTWITTNAYLDAGDTEQSTLDPHSGSSAWKINSGASFESAYFSNISGLSPDTFVSMGMAVKGLGTNTLFGYHECPSPFRNLGIYSKASPDWLYSFGVVKNYSFCHGINSFYGNSGYLDDLYSFKLTDVSLTVTPASQVNSTETSGLRVDGADTLMQPITGLSADRGVIKFKFTPRHSFSTASSFGVTNPVIAHFYSDSNNYIKIHKQDASTLRVVGVFNGTTVNADYASPTLNAGTTYTAELSYVAGGSLTLKINGTQVATNTGVVAFASTPTTAYFGTDNGGANSNPYDLTILNFVTLTSTENTTAPYYKFGSKSVKLVGYDSSDQYTTTATGSANTRYALSAYVYDATPSNVGGNVDSAVATLASGSAALTTTYSDEGGGWWRLTYSSMEQPAGTFTQGIEVKPGKTIYVDGVQFEASIDTHVANTTSYTDGSLGSGYSWSGLSNQSTSVRTGGDLQYPTSNISAASGSLSIWFRPIHKTIGSWGWLMYGGYFSTNSYPTSGENNLVVAVNYLDNLTCGTGWGNGGITLGPRILGQWQNVAITWDGVTVSCYLNGVYKGSQTSSVDIETISVGRGQNWSVRNYSEGPVSALRIFDSHLSASEISDLYHQGLATHSSGSEAVDRYEASGTYTSPTLDLSANGAWGTIPLSINHALNGGGINYYTRTSSDAINWSDWTPISAISQVAQGITAAIDSTALRYFQWKADITSSDDQSQSPTITAATFTYVEDTTPPENPVAVALGYSTAATASADLTSGVWSRFGTPKFTWEAGEDIAASGQSSSGIDAYHVLLTTDAEATPSASVGDDCYLYTQSDTREYIVGSSPANCLLTDNTYYLRVQTKDNSGNVSEPVTLFTYKYDGSIPNAPRSIATTNIGYQAENTFTFYWPAATDEGPSGIAGYEYKTGAEEGQFSEWQYTTETIVSDIEAYQEGQNFLYVRSKDVAGNYSGETSNNVAASSFYYNASAPTAPLNLAITPATSLESPAESNVFSVSWDKPSSYSGEIAKYYYCVNCTPSQTTMTETTAAETVNRTLTNMALATQQGKNTLYLVAEDNNVNTQVGHGNRNFEAVATVDFYASTIAPGAPTNLTISDASNRDTEKWRLTLTWEEPETGGTPVNYWVYRSTDESTYVKVGSVSSTAYTDDGLTHGQQYYYKVKAIDDAGSESLASNVATETPEGKYLTPPSAGGEPDITVGSTTATVSWSTGRSAFGTVEYGKTATYGSAASETTPATAHAVKLTGLSPGTEYHYRVQSLDDSGLVGYERTDAYSSDFTFTTLNQPEISAVTVSDQSLESVVINWTSASLTSASIEYGKTLAYGNEISVVTSSEQANQSARIANLDHSTEYHFRIRGVDVDQNDIFSDDYTFQTITFPKITAAVFNTDQSGQGTTAVLGWSTNVPTTGIIEYQAVEIEESFQNTVEGEKIFSTNALGTAIDPAKLQTLSQTELAALPVVAKGEVGTIYTGSLTQRHVEKIRDLQDGSLYVFTIKGTDKYGNELVSEPIRYVTGIDTKPPTILNTIIETPVSGSTGESKAQMIITFETDEPARSQIIWGQGVGSEYPQATEKQQEFTTQHAIVVRDLAPTTSYHLKILVEDEVGNTSESEDTVVVTPTAQRAAFDIILENLEGVFGFLR